MCCACLLCLFLVIVCCHMANKDIYANRLENNNEKSNTPQLLETLTDETKEVIYFMLEGA